MTINTRINKVVADAIARRKLFNKLIDISTNRIIKQGTGCNIPGLGAAYKYKSLKCSVTHLISANDIKNHTYGCVSDIEQSYIVAKIVQKYNIPDKYRVFAKVMLQKLQDAHDAAFDEYNVVDGDRMEFYLNQVQELKGWVNAN